MLIKVTVEAALNAELDDYLDCARHGKAGAKNSRNGHSSKRQDFSFWLFRKPCGAGCVP